MTGIIVFTVNYKQFEGTSQKKDTHPMPADMTYSTQNMVDVLVAAGKVDGRIGGVVEESATPYNLGEAMEGGSWTTGLLKMPAPSPSNAVYHALSGAKETAIKNKAAGHLEVVEGVHISHSCIEPHLTVVVYDKDRKQVGQKIHVCVEPDGKAWKFKSIHQ